MARRTKRRTHTKVSEEELAKIPRSMVIRLGQSLRNHLLSQLVKDFRYVMQPHTAINLRERKLNKLKDFVVMAGPLGVSEMFIFNQSEETGNISLRVGKMPRGPTLQFRVNTYLLMKDLHRLLKRPKSVGRDLKEFLAPPLLVLNGFKPSDSPHEKLMVTVFQNMFPPIQPQSTKVSSIRRVLMLNKDANGEIQLRHYAINTKLVEESRNIKKLFNQKKKLPNMHGNSDIADLLLDPYSVGGVTSDSEVEDDAVVEIKNTEEQRVNDAPAQADVSTRKRAIKLTELGPRINMTLVKIEEGLVGSLKTIYHAHVKKTQQEIEQLEKKHNELSRVKAERRAVQQANLDAKLEKKRAKKERRRLRKESGEQEEGEKSEDSEESEEESDDDAPEINPEDYENDSDLFSE